MSRLDYPALGLELISIGRQLLEISFRRCYTQVHNLAAAPRGQAPEAASGGGRRGAALILASGAGARSHRRCWHFGEACALRGTTLWFSEA